MTMTQYLSQSSGRYYATFLVLSKSSLLHFICRRIARLRNNTV